MEKQSFLAISTLQYLHISIDCAVITQYARTSSSSTRAVAGNQFVIGDSEDEEEGDDEGEEGMDHVDILIMICHHVLSDHDQIGYSGPDGLRRRPPAMGEVGRKVTRQ